ncbi:hypothetical protein DUI87_29585 [Hirundo rustica rustica]|uniref:ribonuclease H n=1 Tax=Hirundo rustica rustica TaxID=333673 RepID=A0A3M0IZ24_HIRRU|nr:hypothetical protein DUI87_29585 [Hirundo rustica rustica]
MRRGLTELIEQPASDSGDLKDTFFCLPIHEDSQKIFAFEWENPKSGCKSQLTWSVLPQGFKNSPTLFGEQLAKDLESWEAPPEEGKLLQYVDDILIATRTKEACIAWTQGIALGILAQDLGPYRRAVAYFSKQLDTTAKGWPGCLRAVAAVVLNIQEARKFTLGQKMTVFVSHTVSAVLEVKGGHWLFPQRFLKYQAIMVEQDDVEIVVTNIINPASFLSGNQGEPVHDCLETIEASYSSCPDLKDAPLDDPETWFTDGSSYVISGKRHAGYAVTTCREVIESGPLPTNTTAQKAEIIALTCALEIAKGKKVNIYTDSRYAFGVVHTHGAIWKERGLLNSQGKNIKHSQEILRLLEAVQLPEQVAIMHIKAHQKVSSELEEGNELADREAKEAAKGEITIEGALIPDGQVSLEEYKLWEAAWKQLLRDALPGFLNNVDTRVDDQGNPLTLEHIAGEGQWAEATDQVSIPSQCLHVVKEAALTAFFGMQPHGPVIPYSKMRQGQSESFTDFVERLTRATEVQVKNEGAREDILAEISFSNSNDLFRAPPLALTLLVPSPPPHPPDGAAGSSPPGPRTIEEVYSSRSDLKDVPLENPNWELFTDGSSFTKNDKRMTGYSVTMQDKVIEAKTLPADVSSQKAKLIALTRALDLSEGKKDIDKAML